MMSRYLMICTFALALVSVTDARAQLSAADKCESTKLKVAGKYGACRFKLESKAIKTGLAPDFAACDDKFDSSWQTAEDKSEGACPTGGDANDMRGRITDHSDLVALLLSGESTEDPDAIHVRSDTGVDDAACGTQAAPCATIGFGLSRAVTDAKGSVLVAGLAYFEDVTIVDGIDLLGGYDPATWSPSPARSVIYGNSGAGHRAALTASGIVSPTIVDGFEIHGASAISSGANSYAVRVVSSSAQLTLSDNVIYAGAGGPGGTGASSTDGSDGVAGEGRDANPANYDARIATGTGACNISNNRQLSNGGSRLCGATDVSGASGGGNDCPASSTLTEMSGNDGANAAAGGTGGDAGDDSRLESGGATCVSLASASFGADGADGPAGAAGSTGAGCSSVAGLVAGGHWMNSSGMTGGSGTNGRGGGGGGGGGGAYCLSCAEGKDRIGGHGGGGGSGACGGGGGGGGSGGGGSFGLFVSGGAAPVFTGNTIVRGIGGPGGNGASAGSGGEGAEGGIGGADAVYCTSDGGRGGTGGNGGHGGGGGGGCGGSAFAVYTSGVGAPSYCAPADQNTISGGAAGAGGQGGPSLGNAGSPGSSGVTVGCSFN